MKKIITLLIVVLLVAMVGCTSPPEEVPRADVSVEIKEAPPMPEPYPEPIDPQPAKEPAQESGDEMKKEAEDMPKKDTSETARVTKSLAPSSTFEFEGYGPGKSHTGVFDDFTGSLTYEAGKLVGAEITINADSVNTGIGGLDEHLKKDDFFDVAKYPQIKAVSKSIEEDSITGDLTFHGVTKEITFPATVTENSVSTEFVLDTTPFGMTNSKVNKEVRIEFNLVAQE